MDRKTETPQHSSTIHEASSSAIHGPFLWCLGLYLGSCIWKTCALLSELSPAPQTLGMNIHLRGLRNGIRNLQIFLEGAVLSL